MSEFDLSAAIFFVVWSFIIYRIGVRVGRASRDDTDLSGPPTPANPDLRTATVPEHLRPAIEDALRRGRKIEAIRRLREATGLGLKESKEYIEAMQRK